MNDREALEVLRLRLEKTPYEEDLLTLERRLLASLHQGEVYGETDQLKHDAAKIAAQLNRIAKEALGFTFNDLLYGRGAAVAPRQDLVRELAAEAGIALGGTGVAPPVTTRPQRLPLETLDWEIFEILCVALIQSLPGVKTAHRFGVSGNAQQGIDIVATHLREGAMETGVYQCKKHKSFTPKELRDSLKSITHEADFFVVLLSLEAGAPLRQEVDNRKTFLWDALDISRKLKLFPDLVEDFFGPVWRREFCG